MSTVVGELTARVPVSRGATGAAFDFTTTAGSGATGCGFGGRSGVDTGTGAGCSASTAGGGGGGGGGDTGSGTGTAVLAWTTVGAAVDTFGEYCGVNALRCAMSRAIPAIAPIAARLMSIKGGLFEGSGRADFGGPTTNEKSSCAAGRRAAGAGGVKGDGAGAGDWMGGAGSGIQSSTTFVGPVADTGATTGADGTALAGATSVVDTRAAMGTASVMDVAAAAGDTAGVGVTAGAGAGAGTGTGTSRAFSNNRLPTSFEGSNVRTRRIIASATFRYFCGFSFHGESSIRTRAFSRSPSKLVGNDVVTCCSLDIFSLTSSILPVHCGLPGRDIFETVSLR